MVPSVRQLILCHFFEVRSLAGIFHWIRFKIFVVAPNISVQINLLLSVRFCWL